MRKTTIVATALAVTCAGALSAQTPPPTQTPQQQTAAQQPNQDQVTTLTGCVYREQDIPGRAPNVAERAGILEDYILAEISPSTAAAGTAGATGTSGTPPTSGAAAMKSASMFKLEFVKDDELKTLVGKRVEVTGKIDREAGDKTGAPATTPPTTQTDKVLGRDRIDIPEFEVTSIREVTGTCPAKPSGR